MTDVVRVIFYASLRAPVGAYKTYEILPGRSGTGSRMRLPALPGVGASFIVPLGAGSVKKFARRTALCIDF